MLVSILPEQTGDAVETRRWVRIPRGGAREEGALGEVVSHHCQRGHALGPFDSAEPGIQEYGQEVQARKRMAGKWEGEGREMNGGRDGGKEERMEEK